MYVDRVWLTAVLLSFPLLTLCDPLNVMVAPNLLRVGTPEKVFVEAQDYTGTDNIPVRISVKNFPEKTSQLTSAEVVLTAAKEYQAIADITIPDNKNFFSDDPLEKQYVYLQAEFPSKVLEKVVLVSFQSGYIFIQTDKSIYTPETTVNYRIFSVAPDLQPVDKIIIMDIINPEGIIVYRDLASSVKGTITRSYTIPEFARSGKWTIVTQYKNTPQKNFTAEFEVKEYVLPSFEVALKPSKPFFYVDDQKITVDITAKYMFGKEVNGVAFAVFGVKTDDTKTTLSASLKRIQIINGEGRAELTKEMIQRFFPDIHQLIRSSLFVSVSVLTETGSEMVKAEKGGIQIVTSPYTIQFKRTPKFFHPGMSFDVTIFVTNPDQSPAENVKVLVEPGDVSALTKGNGMAKITLNTQDGNGPLQITAKTAAKGIANERQAENKMTAQPYTTKGGSRNYIHLSVDSAELKIGDQININVNFKTIVPKQDVTYLILSKGQIVQGYRFKRRGTWLASLSLPVTKNLIPSFRVVAYYHIESSEVVSDSIWVNVKDTCMGTLKLDLKSHKTFKPDDPFQLTVTGDPNAKVFLSIFLNNKNRLTQNKIWDIIEKHDTGCTAGSGKDSMGVFSDAGLLFESDKLGGTNERTDSECPTPKRRKRSAETQTPSEDDDDLMSFDEIYSRRLFPESWMWITISLPNCKENIPCDTASFTMGKSFVKDSITALKVSAISMSETHGICVADPYEITVAKEFFVDLKLPNSAIHNEQLEVKAILHNFSNRKQKVRVDFLETEYVCSVAHKKRKYYTLVNIDAESTIAIPYVIIPMKVGNHYIEVQAASSSLYDGVRKILKVLPKGVLTEMPKLNLELNPSEVPGGVQFVHLKTDIPPGQVPNTPSHTSITVTGQKLSQKIEQTISGNSMGHLIVQPRGNGEQNMIFMTLPVIATHYLDTTSQWQDVGLHRRSEAIKHIQTGYEQELVFRKNDGSYAAWSLTPSSTWLTAYVAKVFALASDLININEDVLCSALKWLNLNRQMQDGSFKENAPVNHAEMAGGVRGEDADAASLTAFVLIALQEGKHLCARSVGSLSESSRKATEYLQNKLPSLTNSYAVAISSYALANAGKFNKERLLKASSGGGSYWQVDGGHHSLEATAYALLALVKAKEFETAGKVFNWLNRQKSPYTGLDTTQATLLVFQAVAEYYTQVRDHQNADLDVEVKLSGSRVPIKWRFNKDNAHLTFSKKAHITQEINVTAKGTGAGVLKVTTLYYAKPTAEKSDCEKFDLSVEMRKVAEAEDSYEVIIYILFKDPERDATMTILDIGLLTGFVVDENDLKNLATGADKYIQKFEMDKQLSERGSLIMYLDKVSHKIPDRIAFRMHMINKAALLQPAAVSVYEYYSPGDHCVKFFHPTKKDGNLNRLCIDQEDQCLCAEENCSIQKKGEIAEGDREKRACEVGMNYAYKVKCIKVDQRLNTDYYEMKIEDVLKEGIDHDAHDKTRTFMGHSNCRESFGFVKGKSYLIMGHSADLPKIDGKLQYILGEQTWIEYWPTIEEGQTAPYRDKYIGIATLAEILRSFGCSK